jgi:hypothetical protein
MSRIVLQQSRWYPYEYFRGDNGAGLGASHQTGWTAMVVELIGWGDGQYGTK